LSAYETLLVEHDGHVATLTLNRPDKKNAISSVMFKELRDAFDSFAGDDSVRCVVVTGAGGAFCTGADLTDADNLISSVFDGRERMRVMNELVEAFIDCPKPTIATVTGVAAGAGANLALGCDLIVASSEARFIQIFVKRGLVVDFGGSWTLARLLPLNKAKELAFLGDEISGQQADELGLLNRFCQPDEIDSVTKDLAQRVAAAPPGAISLIKQNLNKAVGPSLGAVLADEEAAQALCFTSEDVQEALKAFIEKREPRFTGR
jgi:enoyl-CoA hydratase/carnithine racemase